VGPKAEEKIIPQRKGRTKKREPPVLKEKPCERGEKKEIRLYLLYGRERKKRREGRAGVLLVKEKERKEGGKRKEMKTSGKGGGKNTCIQKRRKGTWGKGSRHYEKKKQGEESRPTNQKNAKGKEKKSLIGKSLFVQGAKEKRGLARKRSDKEKRKGGNLAFHKRKTGKTGREKEREKRPH